MLSHKKRRTCGFRHIIEKKLKPSALLALLMLLALLVPLTLLAPLPISDTTVGVPCVLYPLTTSLTTLAGEYIDSHILNTAMMAS